MHFTTYMIMAESPKRKNVGEDICVTVGAKIVSRTPDRDFRCFCPCEIILSHIPVPARGKDKNRTAYTSAARWSHLDVMIK